MKVKGYELKYMTDAHLTEINELLAGEHGDALRAFAYESVNIGIDGFCDGIANGCVKNFVTGTVAGACAVGLIYVAFDLGERVYHKLKEEKKPTEKPGRVWEA